MEVKYTNKHINSLKGHQCNKGKVYTQEELYNPKRTLTTTVKVDQGVIPLVSVRTDRPIPKKLIFPIINEISQLTIEAPVELGDILLKNVQNTGANIIATKTVGRGD
jgi:CxxC motif-containing protein